MPVATVTRRGWNNPSKSALLLSNKRMKMYAELILKCSTCKADKPAKAFSTRGDRPRGYESRCKECNSKRALKYHQVNRETVLVKMRQRARDQYAKDPKKQKIWSRCTKARYLKQMPKWESIQNIFKFYAECPEGMQVDHIIPLKGKNISGLHTVSNLQYLSPLANAKKYNHWKN